MEKKFQVHKSIFLFAKLRRFSRSLLCFSVFAHFATMDDGDDNKDEGGDGTKYPHKSRGLFLSIFFFPTRALLEEQEEKEEITKGGKGGAPKKKFEVKKWNAVALWAWGSFV